MAPFLEFSSPSEKEVEILEILGKNAEADMRLEKLGKALSSKMRRLILWLLLERGEIGLSQLVNLLSLSKRRKPLMHYHLKVLNDAGLIQVSKVEWSSTMFSLTKQK